MVTLLLLALLGVLSWYIVVLPMHQAATQRAKIQLTKELRAHMAHAVLEYHPLFKALPANVKPSIRELRDDWNVTSLYEQLFPAKS